MIPAHAPSRRILLISFHYGPEAETGGFRWTHMVPALIERGWTFDIIAHGAENGETAPSILAEPPPAEEVHRVAIPPAAALWASRAEGLLSTSGAFARRLLRKRARAASDRGPSPDTADAALLPADPRTVEVASPQAPRSLRTQVARGFSGLADAFRQIGWSRAAIRRGRQLICVRQYAAVVVSSPPHLSHRVGRRLAADAGTPFIPDFRDPWYLGIGDSRRNADLISRTLGRWVEPGVHRGAAVVVHNTERARVAVAAERARSDERRMVIPNGYDSDDDAGLPDASRFRVAFTGYLHPWMDVRVLLSAFARLCERVPEARQVLELVFMGTSREFGGVSIAGLAAHYGIADHVTLLPRAPREEAQRLQESAAVLVAYDCTHPLCVPMKFYDYLRMRGTLLLLGHPDGAMADAAGRLGIPVCAPGEDVVIDQRLDEAWRSWRDGTLTRSADPDGRFHRRHTVAAWHNMLETILRR